MPPIILVDTSLDTPTPTTWTDQTLLTQALLNGEIRDPLRFLTSGCSCTVQMSSSQSIPSGSRTDLSWDTEVTDVDGIISVPSSEFIFTRDGVISFRFYGTFAGNTGGSSRNFIGAVDAGSGYSDVCAGSDAPSTGSALQSGVSLSADFPVLAGYKFKIQAFQDCGSSLNVLSGRTQATLTWVGKTEDQEDYDTPVTDDPGSSTPPTNSTPTKHTKTYNAQWSRSYISSGAVRYDDPGTCYQGAYPGYGGNQRSLVGFDSSTIVSDLKGAQNVTMSLGFYCAHAYWNSGLTAIIGGHGYSSKPGSWSNSSVYQNIQKTHAPKGGKVYIQLNNTMTSNIKSGKYKGIAFGPAPSSDLIYYGYFDGASYNSKPYLYVVYYK